MVELFTEEWYYGTHTRILSKIVLYMFMYHNHNICIAISASTFQRLIHNTFYIIWFLLGTIVAAKVQWHIPQYYNGIH